MATRYPAPDVGTRAGTTVRTVPAPAVPGLRRALSRFTGGPSAADATRAAAALVRAGCEVALTHAPPGATGALTVLVDRLAREGLTARCELTVPVDVLGPAAATLAGRLLEGGLGVALEGAAEPVDELARRLPAARVVVPAAEPGAEERCRLLADGRVRLASGGGAAADQASARCLNVLMSGSGRPAIATADRRLVAIAGERAAWNDRTPDSWEHVMPLGVRVDEQRRLTAAGYRVRVNVPWGPGAPAAVLRRMAGRP
jgi:proline dehydrogenase